MQCHVFDQRGEPEPLFGEQSAVTFAGFGDTIFYTILHQFLTPPYKALPTGEGQSTKNSHYCFTRVFLAFWWGVNTCLKQQKSLSLNLLTSKERRAQEQKQTQEEENKSRSRHNVEGSFLCVLYFGWLNQPSSGTMIILHWYVKKT